MAPVARRRGRMGHLPTLLPRTGRTAPSLWWSALGLPPGGLLASEDAQLRAGAVLVAALAVSVAAAACFPRVQNLHGEPWRRWIDNRTLVVVRLQIRAPPTTIAGARPVVDLLAAYQGHRSRPRSDRGRPELFPALPSRGLHRRGATTPYRPDDPPHRTGARGARDSPPAGCHPTADLLSDDPAAGDMVRDRLSRALAAEPADRRALVSGMALGDDADMAQGTSQLMKDGGLSHLTAVSGANMAIVAGAFALALRAFGASARIVGIVGGERSAATYLWSVPNRVCSEQGHGGRRPSRGHPRSRIRGGFPVDFGTGPAVAGSCAGALPWVRAVMCSDSRTDSGGRARPPGGAVLRGPIPAGHAPNRDRGSGTRVRHDGRAGGDHPLLVAFGLGVSTVSLAANVVAAPFVPIVTIFGLVLPRSPWSP